MGCACAAERSKKEEFDLVLVQIVTRHGARVGSSHIQLPEIEEKIWSKQVSWSEEEYSGRWDVFEKRLRRIRPVHGGGLDYFKMRGHMHTWEAKGGYDSWYLGQLTKLGEKQLIDVGRALRDRYILEKKFLPPKLEDASTAMTLYSSNMLRTFHSLDCLMQGLYPEDSLSRVDAITDMETNVFCFRFPKPSYYDRNLKAVNDETKEVYSKTRENFQSVLEPLLYTFKKSDDSLFNGVADPFESYRFHGIEVEALAGNVDALDQVNDTIEAQMFGWIKECTDQRTIKFRVCKQINAFLNRFRYQTGLIINSAHDVTIAPILGTLGFDKEWPPFASCLIFEIYEHHETAKRFLSVRYNGLELSLPGGDWDLRAPLEPFLEWWVKNWIDDKDRPKKDIGTAI